MSAATAAGGSAPAPPAGAGPAAPTGTVPAQAALPADGAVPGGARREDDDLTADHIRTLYEQTPATLFGNTVGIGILLWMFHAVAPPQVLWSWSGWMLLLVAIRVVFYLRFPSRPDASLQQLVRWQRQWNVTALAMAAGWGISVWIFYDLGERFHFVALILVVYAYMLAGVQVLATQRLVYIGFLSLGMLPMIVRVAIDRSEAQHVELAAIMVIVLVATYGLCIVYRRALESTIRLKVRTEHLAEQLRLEKAEAESARRAAEVANRAKTQFFAAASHDLRQPLHALGLFAEALRQRSHDEQAAQLVNSINSSVDALEGLFSELLDITKIDTGGVEARAEHFSVGDLFQRLRLHFEPTAFEKGLSLRFHGRHHAFADPVLVDRIVRNLLANAIRYTRDGGVLVSCRRRGDRLLLQVWDTGVGIKPREQERIFEEFYQVAEDASPEPHQRKGLGLGLSIVRRLANLIDAPLRLDSQPGRGTVFTLEVPVGKAAPAGRPSTGRGAGLGLTLDRRLIVVVEDEPAVRLGLEVLLKSWGASVVSFESVSAVRAWVDEAGSDAVRPDLLILDYRLESGQTGIDALHALRQRFGRDVPAILVTGSTMTGHEAESQAHDFHVLTKPVVPNKLRAMIAFKLGVR